MAIHSSVLAWRFPGTGEPGGLLSMGSHRVGHDWSDLAAAATGLLKQLLQACETPWDTFILLPPFLVLQPLLGGNCCTLEVVEASGIIPVFLGHRKHGEPVAVHPSWIKGYKWVICILYPLPTTQAPQKHCTHGTEEGNENTQWLVGSGQIIAEIKEEIMEKWNNYEKIQQSILSSLHKMWTTWMHYIPYPSSISIYMVDCCQVGTCPVMLAALLMFTS